MLKEKQERRRLEREQEEKEMAEKKRLEEERRKKEEVYSCFLVCASYVILRSFRKTDVFVSMRKRGRRRRRRISGSR